MIWNLPFEWLLFAIAVVTMLSFFLGLFIDSMIGNDGFGAYGNGVIISGGFFLGVYAANWYGIRLGDMTLAMITGLGGAMICLATLTIIKLALARL